MLQVLSTHVYVHVSGFLCLQEKDGQYEFNPDVGETCLQGSYGGGRLHISHILSYIPEIYIVL